MSNIIVDTLKKKGYRMTSARLKLIQVLQSSNGPLTAKELLNKLSGLKLKVNKTTVYREIEFLKKEDIIQTVLFEDNVSRYEIVNADEHHHHLICDNCGQIQDITISEKSIINQVQLQANFQIKRHSLEFFGICTNCQ